MGLSPVYDVIRRGYKNNVSLGKFFSFKKNNLTKKEWGIADLFHQ